jgi:hypothetical protein
VKTTGALAREEDRVTKCHRKVLFNHTSSTYVELLSFNSPTSGLWCAIPNSQEEQEGEYKYACNCVCLLGTQIEVGSALPMFEHRVGWVDVKS